MVYDYLLIVGPGRSGTDFLYENLRNHPEFIFPEIKEGGYYRSLRRFDKVTRRSSGLSGKILTDISNLAYMDPSLVRGVAALKSRGVRTLVVILLRNHVDRARSMIRYRESRGRPDAWFGRRRVEKAAVNDRLRTCQLKAIFQLDVDVASVEFSTLMKDPAGVLGAIASLCGASNFERVDRQTVNQSTRGRFLLLSAGADLGSRILRALGFRRQLQRLKNWRWLDKLLYVPLTQHRRQAQLQEENVRLLETSFQECLLTIQAHSRPIADGVFFRRSGT